MGKNKHYINPDGDLINCFACGRDTHAKHGYCYRCIASSSSSKTATHISDQKDRHIKSKEDSFMMDSDGFYDDFEDYIDMER